ncbi:hypothetical protein LXA43DRAFT_676405 [Ganoderma leucocontextum]|nr:hypothetical protein LXA43DRAFT_676405 [Ganoderma leucocontextum]
MRRRGTGWEVKEKNVVDVLGSRQGVADKEPHVRRWGLEPEEDVCNNRQAPRRQTLTFREPFPRQRFRHVPLAPRQMSVRLTSLPIHVLLPLPFHGPAPNPSATSAQPTVEDTPMSTPGRLWLRLALSSVASACCQSSHVRSSHRPTFRNPLNFTPPTSHRVWIRHNARLAPIFGILVFLAHRKIVPNTPPQRLFQLQKRPTPYVCPLYTSLSDFSLSQCRLNAKETRSSSSGAEGHPWTLFSTCRR